MTTKPCREFSLTQEDLDNFGIDAKEYEFGRLQYILHKLNKSICKSQSIEYWQMIATHYGIYFDALVRQKKYVPEPSDADLKVIIDDNGMRPAEYE